MRVAHPAASLFLLCTLYATLTRTDNVPHGKQATATLSGGEATQTREYRMPGAKPRTEDAYLCTAFPMSAKDEYIVNYEALTTVKVTHHMLLYGCERPLGQTGVWRCGSICASGSPFVMWAWAQNAKPTNLPKDVGFHMGGSSKVKYLVLQVHYKHRLQSGMEPDKSGVKLTISSKRQKYLAGIYLLLSYWATIPARTKKVHSDISCKYHGETNLYPFAFRVHAHTLGRVITGYQNNGSWSLIGKGNPQWPQAFYPVEDKFTIKPGDFMVGRCTYDSSGRDRNTHIGGTHNDEMCNFYMMYYTDASKGKPYFFCGGNNYPRLVASIPPGSDVPLPRNPLLEEVAKGLTPPPHPHVESHMQGVTAQPGWPKTPNELGQVAGVATDSKKNIYIFHRGSHVWDGGAFDLLNKYRRVSAGPIAKDTVIIYNKNGEVIDSWGSNMFYMPHGLHIDREDNVWVTDVALHQVFKFKAGEFKKPVLTLGQKFVPGSGKDHFCKPTDVAVLKNGNFYVSDGYCNHRVMKFSKEGDLIKEWGKATNSIMGKGAGFPPPVAFDIPHSVTVAEDKNLVCVADRENGRIQCFDLDGNFKHQMHPKEFNGRLFAVSYCHKNRVLYAVNGPSLYKGKSKCSGFTLDIDTGTLLEIWQPPKGFSNPHDVTGSPDGEAIYVGEIGPNKIWKMNVDRRKLPGNVILHSEKKASISHPDSVASGPDTMQSKKVGMPESADFGASMIIGGLLIVPVLVIIIITVFIRLKKSGRLWFLFGYKHNRSKAFNLGQFFSRHKGFDRLPNEESDHELDHLNSDSDVEEYSATFQKA